MTLEYIGKYTCTAVNEGGERSDMINVDVYGKNMCDIVCVCIYLFVCLSVYLPIVLSVSLSVCLLMSSFFCLVFTSFYHPVFPSFLQFISLSPHFIVPSTKLQTIPDQTVTQGLNVTFTCIATVGFGLSYLWTIPHLNCDDCGPVMLNVPTITLTDITNEAQGLYTCIVTDFVNQIATTSSMLTVGGTYLILNRKHAWTNSTTNCFN